LASTKACRLRAEKSAIVASRTRPGPPSCTSMPAATSILPRRRVSPHGGQAGASGGCCTATLPSLRPACLPGSRPDTGTAEAQVVVAEARNEPVAERRAHVARVEAPGAATEVAAMSSAALAVEPAQQMDTVTAGNNGYWAVPNSRDPGTLNSTTGLDVTFTTETFFVVTPLGKQACARREEDDER
jgi:hypothetical protein